MLLRLFLQAQRYGSPGAGFIGDPVEPVVRASPALAAAVLEFAAAFDTTPIPEKQ